MNKTWNDSDLARLSDDLDQELTAIFDQVEAALSPESPETDPADEDQWDAAPETAPPVEADKAEFGDVFAEPDPGLTPEDSPSLTDPAEDETDWLPPALLGEPEIPAGLTPEVMREMSRMIEEAVAKGVAAALAAILKTD